MRMKNLAVCTMTLFFMVTGCKKDDGAAGPGGGSQVITVNGFVKDQNGEPVGGKPVIVTGKTAVITASNGSFSVADVTTPYEITVIAVIGAVKIAVVYNGVTRPDPVLAYPGGPTGTQKNASISGSVPAPPGTVTRVFFTSGDRIWSTTTTAGTYSIFPSWYGPDTTLQGALHVLRHPTSPAIPTDYEAYGSRTFSISDGLDTVNNNFLSGDLTDPTEQGISGAVDVPSEYTMTSRGYNIAFGGANLAIASESAPPNDFSFAAPNISGATFSVLVVASASNPFRFAQSWKTGLTPNTSGVTVTVDTAAQPILPVNNGTNIENPEFQWAQGGGTAANLVYIYATLGQPEYHLYTMAATARIPDLSSQGFGLPPNTTYRWYVERFGPLSSVNDVASDGFRGLTNYRAGDYRTNDSEEFIFTTRP